MDSFELNKIIGAILGTLLFVMGVGFIAEGIYAPITNNGPGYDLPKPVASSGTPAPAAPKVPLATLLANASAESGSKIVKKCQACHNFTEGGTNKTGPDLYNVVDRPIASHPGYTYSDALNKLKDQKWTYANLDKWLLSPKAFAPGTHMTFVGIEDDKDRADVLAYLQTLSHNPVPFPAPAPAAGKPAPAAGDKAAPAANSAKPGANSAKPADSGATPASTDATTPAPGAKSPAAAPASAAPAATPPAQ